MSIIPSPVERDARRAHRWTPSVSGSALLPLVMAIVLTGACGGGPTRPTSVPVTLTVGPNSRLTAPGQTIQLSAVETMSDGSTKDVRTIASWQSNNTNVAIVSPTGLVSAVDVGTARIEADMAGGGPQGFSSILVLAEGTYAVFGQCVQGPDHECVADARVEIVGGPASGRTTMTDQRGNWTIFGVSGVVQVKVSKEGYITTVQDVPQPGAGSAGVDICGPELVPFGASPTVPRCV